MEKKEVRRLSRVAVVGAIFSYIVREGQIDPRKELRFIFEDVFEQDESDFAQNLLKAIIEHYGKLKVIIHAFAPEFTFEKIAPINRAILLGGLAEIKFLDTPPIVVINEYIEIAKDFGEERSAAFINGVLDNFRKNIGKERENMSESQ